MTEATISFFAKCPQCGMKIPLGTVAWKARWWWFWKGLFGWWDLSCPESHKTHMHFVTDEVKIR